MKFIYNLQTDSGFQNPDVWLQLIAVIGVWLFGETNLPDYLVKSTQTTGKMQLDGFKLQYHQLHGSLRQRM